MNKLLITIGLIFIGMSAIGFYYQDDLFQAGFATGIFFTVPVVVLLIKNDRRTN